MANLQAYFSREVTVGGKVRSMLEYGIDYVVGENKLPSHFRKPRYPISYPKHSVVFRDGHHIQLVSSDQPESVAGRSAVHAIIEEMKHNKGEKLKTRLFPSLRGASAEIRWSPYYQGITGVSDTARVDLGEDDWFEEYEKNMDNIFETLMNGGSPKLAIRYARRIIKNGEGKTPAEIAPGTKVHELVEELAKYLPEEMQRKFKEN